MKLSLSSIFITLFFSLSAQATTYYIDSAAPNDTANGETKNSPWKRAPGMKGWSGSYAYKSGDRFIFKGGVTWGADSLPLSPSGSGLYFGVDLTWFAPICGNSFCRPIFDAQNQKTGFIYPQKTLSNNITIDNIEMKRLYWDTDTDFGTGTNPSYIWVGERTGIVIKNCYFHSWSHGPLATTGDDLVVISGGCNSGAGNSVENSIFDGDPDGTNPSGRDSGAAIYQFPVVRNCIARNMSNAFLLGGPPSVPEEVSGSTIGPINISFDKGKILTLPDGRKIDTGQHENAIEPVCSGQVVKVFNNVIRDIRGGVTMLMTGGSIYIYNNIVYNSQPIPIWIDERYGGSAYVYNNTVDSTGSAQNYPCIHAPAAPVFDSRNNFCISRSGGGSSGSNITITPEQALAEGYTVANQYRPTASTSRTVNVGVNLSSLGHSALSSDISGILRPQGAAWDVGAHEFSYGTSNAPNPPSELRVVN